MPSTTKKGTAREALTPEQIKDRARAYADRAHRASNQREGMTVRPWITLYIRRWRYLSGLKADSAPGPVRRGAPARTPSNIVPIRRQRSA